MPRLKQLKLPWFAEHGYGVFLEAEPDIIAVDTETTGFGFHDEAFCATVAWSYEDSWGYDKGVAGHFFELADFDSKHLLRPMLAKARTWIFHGAKFDLGKMINAGLCERDWLDLRRIDDTQIMAHLLDENRDNKLKSLAVSLLGYDDTVQVEIKSGKRKGEFKPVAREKQILDAARRKLKLNKDDGYHLLPREVTLPYAIKDAEWTMQLYEELRPQVAAIPEVEKVYQDEMRLTRIVLDVEIAGMALDMKYLKRTINTYRKKVNEAEAHCRDIVSDPEFKPGSWQQLQEKFAELGVLMKSTDKDHLEELIDDGAEGAVLDLAEGVLEYRHCKKFLETYLEALLREQRDGIFHPSFNLNVRTGRMSSREHRGD